MIKLLDDFLTKLVGRLLVLALILMLLALLGCAVLAAYRGAMGIQVQ